MATDPQVATLGALTELLAKMIDQNDELLRTQSLLSARVTEQGDEIVALAHRISSSYQSVRPFVFSKASVSPMTCLACGCLYAAEPGPELCGPCWTRLGQPEEWPLPIIGTHTPRESRR